MPLSPEEEASAGRRRVLTNIAVVIGMVIGQVAYTALMRFLALWVAGMRS